MKIAVATKKNTIAIVMKIVLAAAKTKTPAHAVANAIVTVIADVAATVAIPIKKLLLNFVAP